MFFSIFSDLNIDTTVKLKLETVPGHSQMYKLQIQKQMMSDSSKTSDKKFPSPLLVVKPENIGTQ